MKKIRNQIRTFIKLALFTNRLVKALWRCSAQRAAWKVQARKAGRVIEHGSREDFRECVLSIVPVGCCPWCGKNGGFLPENDYYAFCARCEGIVRWTPEAVFPATHQELLHWLMDDVGRIHGTFAR